MSNRIAVPGLIQLTTSKGGHNYVMMGRGDAIINSQGNDTIIAAYNYFTEESLAAANITEQITLAGGNSVFSGVNTSYVTDTSSNNFAQVGGNSIIIGGDHGKYTFQGNSLDLSGQDSVPDLTSHDLIVNANYSDIESRSDLTIQGGIGNKIKSSGNLDISNITGDTNLETQGSFTIYGSDGLNLSVGFYNFDNDSSLENIFIAGSGNKTLDASINTTHTTTALSVYADTVLVTNHL